MGVEISEISTAAELEFEASMMKLREMIALVSEAEQKALAPVRAALFTLDKAMAAEDTGYFVQALVGLARAVIALRQTAQCGPLSELPVPPYDLWLPFKAAALRPSDQPSPQYTAAGPVRNKKIASELSALLELLKQCEPEDANLQETATGGDEAEGT